MYPCLQRNTQQYPCQARRDVDVAQHLPISPLQSADISRRTQEAEILPQNVLPASLPLSPPLSTDPRKACLVKPPAGATGARPAQPKPQQNPLRLPAGVSQHHTQEPRAAHRPSQLLVLSCQPSLCTGSLQQEKATLLNRALSAGRAEALGSFPAPRQHQCRKCHLHPKRQLHQACRGSSNSRRKVCLLSAVKAPSALSSFKSVPILT